MGMLNSFMSLGDKVTEVSTNIKKMKETFVIENKTVSVKTKANPKKKAKSMKK